ncbi:chromatin structure-remodeling complex subunit RSC9, partial [Tremellales sp. Uapishka_1]
MFATSSSSSHSSRPIANLPHHSTPHTAQPPAPRTLHSSPYNPDPRELHAGPKNRLFLALRSNIATEVDWALPRLVLASFDQPELFRLEVWVDSVNALREWPEKWLVELEKEAALKLLRDSGEAHPALGNVPEWTRDKALEGRAINSLLIIRNASLVNNNAKFICRASFLSFLVRFFSLPQDFLLELTMNTPEAFHHLLTILQAIFVYLPIPTPTLFTDILSTTLPALLLETRDATILNLLIPLCISALTIPSLPPLPELLIPHLLNLLTLRPSFPTLEVTLDLLISLTLQPNYARQILALPNVPGHLKSLALLLKYNGKPKTASWDPPHYLVGRTLRNPASGVIAAEEASRRRARERELAQQQMEVFGGPGVFKTVGEKAPILGHSTKAHLFQMHEPRRSITWMHETFVYSSNSQLLQVTFWHAYRDFFQHTSTVEPLLSASEVIKNVTVAFPGASAKIWIDPKTGEQKFVIAGMGFRKGSDEEDRFTCLWKSCTTPTGATSPSSLLTHIQTAHLTPLPTTCSWAKCTRTPFTLSHLLTHLPLTHRRAVPDTITVHPSLSDSALLGPVITTRPPAPLSSTLKLSRTGLITPLDARNLPTGVSFLSALLIRNLARTLRVEIAGSVPVDAEQKEEKKKHLDEDRFGLPIPDSVLKEEEEEEQSLKVEVGMTQDERERAKWGFQGLEADVVEIIENDLAGLGQYLGEAFGW